MLTAKCNRLLQSLRELWPHLNNQVLAGFKFLSPFTKSLIHHALEVLWLDGEDHVADPLLVHVIPASSIWKVSHHIGLPLRILDEIINTESLDLRNDCDLHS